VGLLILNEAEVRRVVDRSDVIESQRAAYRAAAKGEMTSEGVLTSWDQENDVLVFAVTGAISGQTGVAFKIGSQMSANALRPQSSLHSMVILTDPETGAPLALLEGSAVTALRTAGGIAAALGALAPADASILGVYGAGPQAREAVRMVSAVRDLKSVLLFSREPAHCNALAESLNDDGSVGASAIVVDPRELASTSDIIVTCTSSLVPVFDGEWLKEGATVATVGSFAPERREIDLMTTERARAVFVDDVKKSREWSGPLREAMDREGGAGVDVTAIGTVLAGEHPGRTSRDDILVFHSLGLAIQDAALGRLIYERAQRRGIGTYVEY
jgi:ornithine cyclodeaminase